MNADSEFVRSITLYAFLSTQFYSSFGPGSDKDYAGATCYYDDKGHPNATALFICGLSSLKDFIHNGTICYDHITSYTNFLISEACQGQIKNEANKFTFAIGKPSAHVT